MFYTGCNVLKTPHIALLALDIMDALDVSYHVMGGPSHCCGVVQMRTGDVDTSGRFGENTLDKLAQEQDPARCWPGARAASFSSARSRCRRSSARAAREPFEMTPFVLFLRSQLERAAAAAAPAPWTMRIALHRHTGAPGVMEAAAEIADARCPASSWSISASPRSA